MEEYVGAGVSQAAEDNLIPIIRILQDGSPQCKKREEKYVEGAEAGMILDTSTQRVWDGEAGVLFQPCAFTKAWVEWIPRIQGGGFVGQFPHDEPPPDMREEMQERDGRDVLVRVRNNGHELQETRYHFGILYENGGPRPVVIALTSSGHTVSRQWMVQMNQVKIPGTDKIAPSFARIYRLTTKLKKFTAGDAFIFNPQDEGWVSQEQLAAGSALHDSVMSGAKMADHSADVEREPGEDETPF